MDVRPPGSGHVLEPLTVHTAAEVLAWVSSRRDAVQFAGPDVAWPLTPELLVAGTSGHVPHALRDVDGRLVATGSLRRTGERVGRIGRVLVDPAARGRGWGRRMMLALLDRARDLPGIDVVELGVYTFNTAAVALYTDLGFRPTGAERSTVVAGEVWISLELRRPL
ncbi:GNAT family N-acetyltransferase [Propionicicella superfundia]|uniref:GNAT family N-acetyltransferase n=1 Tax=Propionicicella superfundia TaxID=348582 RepID=UPI00146A776B|nr:GNAT family N-acetyltransferase [Propionicicella superfundia]